MTIMWQEMQQQPEVLEKCLANRKIMDELVNKISSSDIRTVVIAARGTSDHAAIYGKYIMEYKLGLPVSLAAPSILTAYNESMDYRNCLVIAISQSGQAKDALAVIKQGKKCGTVTVGITNDPGSPIAEESNFHIYTKAGPEKSVAATKTFLAQLMSLALLVSVWSEDDFMLNELSVVPKNLAPVFDLSDDIDRVAKNFSSMQKCFVLARGINYAIALEAALKIQETSYVEAKGFAISDFYHGPIAMIDGSAPVLVFAPNGPTLSDSAKILKKLNELGAKIILVSNNDALIGSHETVFRIPSTANDIISPFYNTVISQMFACRLSLAKGLDPDRPRSLRKVTITK